LPASALLLGAVFFSFQIYCDFSGYSDIAIGVGNLFGISFLRNFSYPYFTKNIVDFWKSWHISLTSWFKDYVFIPLGGSRGSWLNKSRNVLIIFLISGLWHGANWTFVFWGLLNALFFLVYTSFKALNFNTITPPPTSSERLDLIGFLKVLANFFLLTFLWIFFRSENLSAAFSYLNHIISPSIISNPFFLPAYKYALLCLILIFFFIFIEWKGKRDSFAIENIFIGSAQFLRWVFYGFIVFLIAMYAQVASSPFIYFQF
jgi:alginate O-acetyltransferase complex protein AlgI